MAWPCKGRESGCAGEAPHEGGRCENCRLIRNEREAAYAADRAYDQAKDDALSGDR